MNEPHWRVGVVLNLHTEVSDIFVEYVKDALLIAKGNALQQLQRHVANMTVDDIQATYVESSIDLANLNIGVSDETMQQRGLQ